MKVLLSAAVSLALPALSFAQDAPPQEQQNWQAFQKAHGAEWIAQWNPATGTPSAVYGPGLRLTAPILGVAPARIDAEALLNQHAKLLGRGGSKFVERIGVKANRVFVFVYDQEFQGLPVISGRADVRIHERGVVAMFGASAVEIPAGFNLKPGIESHTARATAEKEILGGVAGKDLPTKLVIWADTGASAPTKATLAWEVQIDNRPKTVEVGKAYVDARTGAFIQFKNEVFTCGSCGKTHISSSRPSRPSRHLARLNRAAHLATVAHARPTQPAMALTGKVIAWTNTGLLPTDALKNIPLANVLVTSSAGNAYTDANGNFSIPYTGTTAVLVSATLRGRHSQRIRVSIGTQMSASSSITPGTAGTIQFGTSTMGELDRSQTTTYHFVDDANVWLRSLLPTATSEMNRMSNMNPRVNINRSCNAYYTNFTINFYNQSSTCNMTAYSTVIYHEWGHGLDHAFGGITQTDGLSEGWSDTVAIFRVDDHYVGRGFRKGTTSGIRSGLNTLKYPVNSTSPHTKGQTWMGFNWDVRINLIAKFGKTLGAAHAEKIVIASIAANARNQPDAVREVFILDDDDGNLLNGTPNYNELEKAALKRTLPYPKKVNPNAGTYVSYGAGCAGSGLKVGVGCVLVNTTGTPANFGTRVNLIYAIRATAPTDLKVSGFELYTSGNQTVATTLYDADTAGRPKTALATSSMVIGSNKQWYRTTFASPLTIKQGQQFFVAFKNNPTTISASIRSGTQTPYFRNDGAGGSWNGPLTGFSWAFKVNCVGGPGAIPALANFGLPELNSNFQLRLTAARPNATGLLLIGASDKTWNSVQLPLDLGPFGATNCLLLASGEIPIGITTSAQGAFTNMFSVPNNPSLFNLVFYNQYVISDSANTFGLVFSNAGRGKIGKQ